MYKYFPLFCQYPCVMNVIGYKVSLNHKQGNKISWKSSIDKKPWYIHGRALGAWDNGKISVAVSVAVPYPNVIKIRVYKLSLNHKILYNLIKSLRVSMYTSHTQIHSWQGTRGLGNREISAVAVPYPGHTSTPDSSLLRSVSLFQFPPISRSIARQWVLQNEVSTVIASRSTYTVQLHNHAGWFGQMFAKLDRAMAF